MPMIIIGHTFNGYPINSPIHQFPLMVELSTNRFMGRHGIWYISFSLWFWSLLHSKQENEHR